MKLEILDKTRNKVGELELPKQFGEEVRDDLIKMAVISLQSAKKQVRGASVQAGKRSSSVLSKRRRDYRGSYGFGISRTPRKILSSRGRRMYWVGAFAPNTVGGRRAHPPKSEKNAVKKINKKERKKAIRCGISATVIADLVKSRGHMVPENYPFLLDEKFEDLNKTKDVLDVLKGFGFGKELERVSVKKIRAGKGKNRGRKYRTKKGPLVVVSKKSNVEKAVKNVPGVDVVEVKELNAEMLAPGTHPGRLTLWTKPAVEALEKERLFL